MNLRPRCRADDCDQYVDALGKVLCPRCWSLLTEETRQFIAQAWGNVHEFEKEVVRACRELARLSARHRRRG